MTKPINLKNAKPGDTLVCRDGTRRVVDHKTGSTIYAETDTPNAWREDGSSFMSHIFDIIRIVPAKPAKKKRDALEAEWYVVCPCRSRAHARELANNIDNGLRKIQIMRRGSIARRLEKQS